MTRQEELTIHEEDILAEHRTVVENSIIEKYHVIATTVGMLSDMRLYSFSKHHKIGTVIADEVSQMNQLSTLSLFLFDQRKTIFIGDNKQLKSVISSPSSSLAGLAFSIMDWLDIGLVSKYL